MCKQILVSGFDAQRGLDHHFAVINDEKSTDTSK